MAKWWRRSCCAFICGLILACAGGITFAGSHLGASPASNNRETLVWSDEFTGSTSQSPPNPANWNYDVGAGGWGNNELEVYCSYGSNAAACDPKMPNAYVGDDGYLHIVARQPSPGTYTSARIKSEGLQSFAYGRLEARVKMPAGKGFWPAFWMLGDNIKSVDWPACGEMDIMETVGTHTFTNVGSIHGTGFTGTAIGTEYKSPNNAKFSDGFHTFGILWSPKQIKFYVDDPKNVYVTYTPASLPRGALWPFDSEKFFFILNLAVGGYWPGSPDATSIFPQEMLVDYIRVYAEPGDPSARSGAAARK